MDELMDFLKPVNLGEIHEDRGFNDGQIGKYIRVFAEEFPDLEDVDVVLLGTEESRGAGFSAGESPSANFVRKQFYQLHHWHDQINIADLGNVIPGTTLTDTYAAIRVVVGELISIGKKVIFLGSPHDLMLGLYFSFREAKRHIEATCIDACIDLRSDSPVREENFLLEMLTDEPNYIQHYNHIGFQSYFVHPRMLETMDKLRFDCFRVGVVKDAIEEMEPVIRNTHLLGFDISAIRHSNAPSNTLSPNGFDGEDACTLMQYAGMSPSLECLGIFGYYPHADHEELTAMQIAQMIWYYIDGRNKSLNESPLEERDNFNEYHTAFAELDTLFLQSKRTHRWWMQMPNKKFISCSHSDYINASKNHIPERWLRVQERDL